MPQHLLRFVLVSPSERIHDEVVIMVHAAVVLGEELPSRLAPIVRRAILAVSPSMLVLACRSAER